MQTKSSQKPRRDLAWDDYLLGASQANQPLLTARRVVTSFKRLYDASEKTLNRVADSLAALRYRELLCKYNLTRSEIRFIRTKKKDRSKKVSALRGKLGRLNTKMGQVENSVQSVLAGERWDQLIGAIQDNRGWQHLDHPDTLLGNRSYSSLCFMPARVGHEDLTNPSSPKFAHARRVFSRQRSHGHLSQYLIFLTGHSGLVDDPELKGSYSRDRELDLVDLFKIVQGKKDSVVDLHPAGMPVIALGTQSKYSEGNSCSTGRRRPYSWVLDNDHYKAPLYYNIGDHNQALTWFNHWRHITAVASTPRKVKEQRILWETSYEVTKDWEPKLKPEDSKLEGWASEDWKLIEVKEQLRLRRYKFYNDIDHCGVVDPHGMEHVWHTNKDPYYTSKFDKLDPQPQPLPTPRWGFEIIRYGILQNLNDPKVLTLVPVSLSGTRGWRWHIWLKDVTQSFCDQLYAWTKSALQYVCQGKDDSFSNLVWWNRPRIMDAWYGKDHKSLNRNVPWKQWFEPHLPLLKLREERGLLELETAKLLSVQRTSLLDDDYLQKVQLYNQGLIRYYEPDWDMPVLDPDCDPAVIAKRYDQGWYEKQSEYEINLASLSGTWSQLQEDSRKLQEDPRFEQFYASPELGRVNIVDSICNALASASFARSVGLTPIVPTKKATGLKQESIDENYWKRQGTVTGGSLLFPNKESLLLMGLLLQRGPP